MDKALLRASNPLFLLALLAIGQSASARDASTGPPPIYSSIVISGPDTVLIGGSVVFTATVIDTGGNPVASPSLTFSSSAVGVATVNNAGSAQGVSEGDVTIRASGGGIDSNALPLAVLQGYGWVDQSAAAPSRQEIFFPSA